MKAAAAVLAVTACTAPGEQQVPVYGSGPGAVCDAAKAYVLAGKAASTELGARALQLSGARGLRWIRPGDAVTMDYREDRLNVELDGRGKVKAIRCG